MTTHQRKLKREAQARWRARHPILAAWHAHKWNAKDRGLIVAWTFPEFAGWCEETGYHILRHDGYQIHRRGDVGPYSAQNCVMVLASLNRLHQFINTRNRRKGLKNFRPVQSRTG